jgi:hypothetical protein
MEGQGGGEAQGVADPPKKSLDPTYVDVSEGNYMKIRVQVYRPSGKKRLSRAGFSQNVGLYYRSPYPYCEPDSIGGKIETCRRRSFHNYLSDSLRAQLDGLT